MKRVHLVVSGDVQGVGFRAWARRQAKELGLTGWVKNREDDTVEIVSEGAKDRLDEFVKLCQSGPEISWVERVDITWENATNEFLEFEVLY
ncbi:MAG TPA: acylphosphatase [Patescibacteria group bacterium]|jgi:acylphosphatase|nr:acylphosphatase [Patescibacteria group bacterium]